VFARQHHVQQDQIEGRLAGAPGSSNSIAHHLHVVAFHLQVVFQAQSDRGFIFDYKNACHALFLAGSSSVNVLPQPGSLANRMCLLCAGTIWRTMVKPTRVPSPPPAAAALPRTNFRNMALFSDLAMPAP